MEKLIIKNSEWSRGGVSSLKHPYLDQYCCLGLDALRTGIKPYMLEGIGTPDSLLQDLQEEELMVNDLPYFQRWATNGENTDIACEAMRINDERGITDEQRITELRETFAKVGIEIDWRPYE